MINKLMWIVCAIGLAFNCAPKIVEAANQATQSHLEKTIDVSAKTYVVRIKGNGVYKTYGESKQVLSKSISQTQNHIIAKIKSLDSSMRLVGRLRLFGNNLTVTMNDEAASEIAKHGQVESVRLIRVKG